MVCRISTVLLIVGCVVSAVLVSSNDTPNYGRQFWSTAPDRLGAPTVATAFPCQAKRGHRQLLLGGVSNVKPTAQGGFNESSTALSSLDLNLVSHGWFSQPDGLDFQVNGQGSCTTNDNGDLFVTNTGGSFPTGAFSTEQPTARDYFVYQLYNASTHSKSTRWLGITQTAKQRARAALLATGDNLFLFGGIEVFTGSKTTFTPMLSVERYSLSSNIWEPQYATMPATGPHDPQGYCDCLPFKTNTHIVLVCAQCDTSAQGFTNNRLSFLKLDYSTNPTMQHIGPKQPIEVPFASFLSFEATQIGQYIVLLVSSKSKDMSTMYYFDIVTEQLHLYNATHWMKPNEGSFHGGGFFIREFTAYYVGGILYTETNTEDLLSTEALTLPVMPTTEVHRKNQGTIYTGDLVTFVPANRSICTEAVRLKVGSDMACTAHVGDVISCLQRKKGEDPIFAWIAPPDPVETGYVCLSYGTCEVDVSQRIVCPAIPPPSGGGKWTFTQCLMAGCCYDAAATGGGQCYSYGNPNSTTTRYYINVDAFPLQTVHHPVPTIPKLSFFQTTPGVITICATAGIIVILAVIVIAYFQRKKPSMEHPLENNAKYRLLTKVGEGGFGTVFLVEKKGGSTAESKERYAMKYIACQSEEDRGFAMKEFELIRSAQGHPNMIKLIDMFMSWSNEDEEPTGATGVINTADESRMKNGGKSLKDNAPDGSPLKGPMADERKALLNLAPRYVCIVMDFYADGDLSSHIRKKARHGMDESFLMKVLCRQTCELLQYLHSMTPPIVHRDMKPENILLAENLGKVVVTDFGLAQEQEKSYMTTRAGSLHYVAPECWKRHYTCAVDMWGLGCIMYAAATGRVTADTARVMFSDARDRGFEKDIRYDLRRFSIQFQDIVMGFLTVDPLKRMTPIKALAVLDSL